MNRTFGSNIDDIRAEIMRLEAAPRFDAVAWSRALADLSAAGRVSALADARRRMETARHNQPAVTVETGEQRSQVQKGDTWCGVCEDWIGKNELRRWTGDDQLHFLCPGCGQDMVEPILMEA